MDPRFDSSFADLVAYRRPLAGGAIAAILAAILVFALADPRTRARWRRTLLITTSSTPYRSAEQRIEIASRAPALVRAAALACFAFGHLFVPGLLFTLTRFRFDGIGVSLIPGVAIAAVIWLCGWLLLSGSSLAREASRVTAIGSLALHHVCSSTVAFVAFFHAGAAIVQSTLILGALRVAAPSGDHP